MPRGTIDWKSTGSYTRLLAAMVAAQDMKNQLNYKKIADMYGEGATYDSIEGRFRIIKKEAAKLKDEIDTGARPEAPQRGNGSPRKQKDLGDCVITGRITKPSSTSSPSKKRSAQQIKRERAETSTNASSSHNGNGSFPSSDAGFTDESSFNNAYDPAATALSFEHLSQLHADPMQYMLDNIEQWNNSDEHVV